MRRAPAVFAFLALAAGVLAADTSGLRPAWWAATLCVTLLGIPWAYRRRRGLALLALVVFAAAGGFATAAREAPAPTRALCEPESSWELRVASPVTRVITDAEVAQSFTAELVAEECDGAWQPRPGRVHLTCWTGPALRRGDLIRARLTLFPLAAARNPTDEDLAARNQRRQLTARAKVHGAHVIVSGGRSPLAWLDAWRHRAAAAFEAALAPEAAAVAKAVAIGDRGGIEAAQREVWARAGIAHLLAISGLHVAFVAALVFGFWRLLLSVWPGLVERRSVRRLAASLTIPAPIVYCLASGAAPSAVRATTMAVAFLLGIAIGRPSTGVNALGLAGLLILGLDPLSLYDPGFLLSFAAVGALLLAPRLPPAHGWRRAGRFVAVSALASITATLATAPITASLFGSVSLVAPLTNLLAVPLGAGLATPAAILHAVVAPWAPGMARPLAAVLELALAGLERLATLAGSAELAALAVPAPSSAEVIAYYVLIVGGVLLASRRRMLVPVGIAALVLLGSLAVRLLEARGDGQLTLIHPYVGQGEATIVRMPSGAVMVYDAGGSARGRWDPGRAVIAPLLRRQGSTRIDLAVLSHPHPDHIGGWRYLIEHFPVAELWWSGAEPDEPMQRQVLAAAHRRGVRVRTAAELPAVVERDGIVIEVLHPRSADETQAVADLNDISIVLRLRLDQRSFLLTGDIGVAAEERLAPTLPPTDVFKSPHHGSRSSSSGALLAALRPRAVVLSVGEDNAFGLPHAEVLARYALAGLEIWRTDVDGAVTARTDGTTWTFSAYRRPPD